LEEEKVTLKGMVESRDELLMEIARETYRSLNEVTIKNMYPLP
jgi:hypothetical protein